jgi:RNA polymerase sigma factor (sigma-70 family)
MSELDADNQPLEPALYTPGATTIWNNSWRQIYDHFANAILAYARRRGLNDHSAEDVLQEVMTTLIRCQYGQAAGYDRNAGSFQAWLWAVIRNRVHEVRRKGGKEIPLSPIRAIDSETGAGDGLPEVPLPPPDFEQMEEDEWQRALLAAALRKTQERVEPDNFAIYTALLEEKATPAELSQRFGKEPNAIYAVKHRCDKILVDEARLIRKAWEQLHQKPIL